MMDKNITLHTNTKLKKNKYCEEKDDSEEDDESSEGATQITDT